MSEPIGLPPLPDTGEEVSVERLKLLAGEFKKYQILAMLYNSDLPSNPFRSDGCSIWPDDWLLAKGFKVERVSLYPACFWHDVRYWSGKPGDDLARLEADAALMIDVAKIHSVELAELMFAGVRAGGIEELKLPFSWGFGWR